MEEELTSNEENSTDEVVKTEKTFTQQELERIVQDRLKREKDASKRIKEEFDTSKVTYEEKIQKYEEILEKTLESQMRDLPEPMRKLLEKLPLLERLEFLNNPENLGEKRKIPSTPKPVDVDTTPKKSIKKIF